jgi:hypothetical protein
MSKYFQKTPLTIHHDWSKTILVARKLMALEDHVGWETFPPNLFGPKDTTKGSAHYDLGIMGVLSKNHASPQWYRIAGPVINKTMPWINDLLGTMKELGPDDGAISFLQGDAAEHVDQPKDKSALNYIFYNTDPMAHTYAGTETYSSVVGDTWILDATVPHGIKNNGDRWTLSIHFAAPYNELQSWAESNKNLVYGQ